MDPTGRPLLKSPLSKHNEGVDHESEKAAIMKVIEEESTAFWNRDFDAYAMCWAHAPYVRTMGWWEIEGVTVVEGWENRASRAKSYMATSQGPNPTASTVRRENVNIRIHRDVAWLTFDQFGVDTGDRFLDMPGLSRETRILEKESGQWKIVYSGWLLEAPEKTE